VKIEVQLFATLAAYRPAAPAGNGVALDVEPGTTVAQVVEQLRIPADVEYLTVVNGHDAPAGQVLADGDVLSMFPPLAGGA
jgi:molybdopterin converting factor small subunit